MKTLKFLILVLVVACFSVGTANAQSPKTTFSGTYWQEPFYVPCYDENVSGTLNISDIWVNNKFQMKIWGAITGETTGNVYTVNHVVNENWNGYWGVPGHLEYTYVVNMQFRLDGKLVFILHENYHFTFNQNDELVVELDNLRSDCK